MISLLILSSVLVLNKLEERKYIGQGIESQNTISVTETGEVFAKPDLGQITFSAITEKETVSEAMNENSKKMNNVISSLKDQGVEDKDMKTVSFNLYPRYDYIETGFTGRRVLSGFEVRQSLEVKIRDLDKIGSIIESATETGANSVGNLELVIENQEELKNQARDKAVEKAKEKAEELAGSLEVKLGKIVSFSESSQTPRFATPSFGMGGAESASPSIEPGENKIQVSVTVSYQIL